MPGASRPPATTTTGRAAHRAPSLIAAAVILAAATVVYLPALDAGRIWDDATYVFDNPTLRDLDGLRQIWLAPAASPAYYPVVFSSFWLEHRLWGDDPFGYHLVNVLLHGLNALLAYVVLRRLSVPGAWLGALLFALHPVHVESVAWIAERKDLFSAAFFLLALLAWLRFVAAPTAGRYVTVLALHAAALLSKSVAASFPAVALLATYWQRGRVGWRQALATLPLVALSLALALVTAWRERLDQTPQVGLGLLESVLVAGRNLAFYVRTLVAPFGLMSIYPRWEIDLSDPLQYAWPLLAVAVIVTLWLLRRRWGVGPFVAALGFVLLHLPTLGLVSFHYMHYAFVADRYQYLAVLAPLALCGALVGPALARRAPMPSPRRPAGGRGAATAVRAAAMAVRWPLMIPVVLALSGLGTLTWRQAARYEDAVTLSRHNLELNPEAWGAHVNLGVALGARGERRVAIEHLERALEIEPDAAVPLYNLSILRIQRGELEPAIDGLERLLAIDPDYPDARYALGVALTRAGRLPAAIDTLERALDDFAAGPGRRPGVGPTEIRLALADARYLAGRYEAAAVTATSVIAELPAADPRRGYLLLTRFLAVWRLEDRAAAGATVTGMTSGDPWCGELLDFYRGRFSAAELLAMARAAPAAERPGRLCEAHYYIGMALLLEGDAAAARAELEACVATGLTHFTEHERARQELRALGSR
jgi:tetratricopeptide (TPR) repeat protein